jgi:hypothetical protein
MVADYDKVIAPGGSGKLAVKVLISQRRGEVGKWVEVFSNSKENPRVLLRCAGRVWSYFDLFPGEVAQFRTPIGMPAEHEVTFRAADGTPFTVKKVESSADYLDTEVRPVGEGTYTLKIKVLPTAPMGPVNQSVRVHTTHPKKPVIEIQVRGHVEGPIEYPLVALFYGRNEPGETNYATLKARSDIDFKILKVKPPEGFEAKIVTLEPGRHYNLEVTLKQSLPPPQERVMTIETDEPRQPTIPVYLRIEEVSGVTMRRPPSE